MEQELEKEKTKWEQKLQGMQTALDSRDECINSLEEKIRALEILVNSYQAKT